MIPNERNITIRKISVARARRRAKPGSGSSREFLLARTWKGLPPVNIDVTRLQTPCVIVGGVATALYMTQRVTYDLDLLVTHEDAPALHQELEAQGCTLSGTLSIGGTTWTTQDGGEIDVIESGDQWAIHAVSQPNRAPDGSPVIALPYLVLMKLDASRGVDERDLYRMLGQADETALAEVRRVIAAYRPHEMEDLETMIRIGALELQGGS